MIEEIGKMMILIDSKIAADERSLGSDVPYHIYAKYGSMNLLPIPRYHSVSFIQSLST